MAVRVAIDTGGTFTDLIAYDEREKAVRIAKQPSTPSDPAAAIMAVMQEAGLSGKAIGAITIGTTVGTNAILERTGARVLFVTTAGFEDVLFIQRLDKQRLYDLHWVKPHPLVSRSDCIGVRERIDHHGSELVPLDAADVEALVAAVRSRPGIQAIAVCLLFSYINPSHEQAIKRRLASEFPELPISLASDISPVWREYERGSTTVADSYVKPVLQAYVHAVDRGLHALGVEHRWNILKSNGGYMSNRQALEQPVPLLLSGLAGGVIGGKYFGHLAGEANFFTLDMGGTSCDIGIVRDGQQFYANEFMVEWGIPITLPRVLVETIGAGGGSIARLDKGGLLHVGPESAGAVPGPAAYGRGGAHPTVTDANLLLGRLNPTYFLGGKMMLHADRARDVLEPLAAALGADTLAAAHAVIETADENMANAVRLISVDHGLDPREFALMAFGGAGPGHARAVAEKLGVPRVLIPLHPGLCSAFGALIADWRVDKVWTAFMRSDTLDADRIAAGFRRLETAARDDIVDDGFTGDIVIHRSIDMRYAGQNYEREIPLPDAPIDADVVTQALDRFGRFHEAYYGFSIEGELIEFVNFRVTAIGRSGVPQIGGAPAHGVRPDPTGERPVYFGSTGVAPCPIYRREHLAADTRMAGPAVIEEVDSTTVVHPGDILSVTPSGVMMIQIGGAA